MGYAALNTYARPSSAVSEEAREVRHAATGLIQAAERSQSLFGDKAEAISQLRKLAEECAETGWDGDEASPIEFVTLQNAEAFLRAMPAELAMPELAPEPDGSISMDWIPSVIAYFHLASAPVTG
jgi:hypothetical protein